MNKPISVAINETRVQLSNACNQSGLPLCILRYVVKDLYEEVVQLAELEAKQEKAKYEKSLVSETKENNDNK